MATTEALAALQVLWDYLGLHQPPEKADCIVGFGNFNVNIARRAAELYHQGYADRILFDFSVVSDMNYYNGILMGGYISGVSDRLLSGGQYDKLMEKLGRTGGAIGFALYLDLLEELPQKNTEYDVDVLLLYDDPAAVPAAVAELTAAGKTVSAQRAAPHRLRCRETIDLRKEAEVC